MQYTVVEVERRGHVGIVWLNRPEKLNAFNLPMWDEVPHAVAALDGDSEIRVIVVAGRGRCLTAGIDLFEFGPSIASEGSLSGKGASGAARRRHFYDDVRRLQRTMSCFADTDKPTIGVAHGWSIGAGMDLLTACDIRIAAEDAIFGVRETKIAMAADVGSLQRLPRIIPAGHAAELIYTGKDIDATRAHAIGLVNSVHPDFDAAFGAAMELAEEIASNAPLAVQGSKHVVRANDGRTVDEALDYVALWNSAFIHTNDLREAMTAMIERRSPAYEGE